jgi:2-polyprenyl-3-methyl-5-hydroxy-6-metoxy-1,4-benzoquinol methylase
MKYREILYSNYHTTQSGRASGVDAVALFNRERWRFSIEILPLVSNFKKDAKIYDFGCGSGSLLSVLKDAGFSNLLGMDLSGEQVKLAHSLGVDCVKEQDALAFLKESSETYDLIFGMDIIEHFTKNELVELLTLIKTKLNPGGKAIFRTPNLDAPLTTVFANGDFTHENYMNASSAQQVCMACGFDSVQVNESSTRVQNPFKEIIRKFFWGMLKFRLKLTLFATGRSTQNVLFTPNMIIVANALK